MMKKRIIEPPMIISLFLRSLTPPVMMPRGPALFRAGRRVLGSWGVVMLTIPDLWIYHDVQEVVHQVGDHDKQCKDERRRKYPWIVLCQEGGHDVLAHTRIREDVL